MPLNLPPAPTTGDKAWQDWGNAVRTELERFGREISPVVQPSLMVLDPFANDKAGGSITGHATILVTPTVGGMGVTDRTVGLFMKGQITGTFSSSGDFIQGFAQKWGETPLFGGATIPAGTLGNFCGYEANISTSQAPADVTEGSHLFGGTTYVDNGSPANGVALAMNVYTVAPGGSGVAGFRLTLENHIGIGTGGAYGSFLAATGPVLSGDAMMTFGNWATGWNAYGHNAVNVSAIAFAQPFPLGGTFSSLAPTDYVVDGSQSDTFRLQGGGSAGGFIVYGARIAANAKGHFRFRTDPVTSTEVAYVDMGNGNFFTTGVFEVASTATQAAVAGRYRIYLDPADSKLKAIGPGGTVTVLALP